jgi:hypothetical protein
MIDCGIGSSKKFSLKSLSILCCQSTECIKTLIYSYNKNFSLPLHCVESLHFIQDIRNRSFQLIVIQISALSSWHTVHIQANKILLCNLQLLLIVKIGYGQGYFSCQLIMLQISEQKMKMINVILFEDFFTYKYSNLTNWPISGGISLVNWFPLKDLNKKWKWSMWFFFNHSIWLHLQCL